MHFSKTIKTITLGLLFFSGVSLLIAEPSIESKSSINWITREFTSSISLDTKKEKIQMPSGKKSASTKIKTKMPQLIQPPLLSLFTDNTSDLADMVIYNQISFDQVNNFIMSGYKSPDIFSKDMSKLNTTNKLNVDELGKLLVRHQQPYRPELPIESVYSRPYTGIIIDARGEYTIHGEYVKSQIYPCFYPTIWDDKMNRIYEKNMVNPELTKKKGMVAFHYSDNLSDYEYRVGADPLYIRANQVYGHNRTDPVIKHKDALKIFSVPENLELLKEGKVVILLDKANLIYDIASIEKDYTYYVNYEEVKQYFYENKVPDVIISDSLNGILFSVDLKFYPDSPVLLPSEAQRIDAIAENLKKILENDGYTILIEGHTADIGKPVGQLNLSIERATSVMQALINHNLSKNNYIKI